MDVEFNDTSKFDKRTQGVDTTAQVPRWSPCIGGPSLEIFRPLKDTPFPQRVRNKYREQRPHRHFTASSRKVQNTSQYNSDHRIDTSGLQQLTE